MTHPRSRRAFTLIELLVAGAVSIMMVALLAVIVQNILRDYQRTQFDTATSRDAEFALDVIVPDVEAMVIPRKPGAEALRATAEVVNGEVVTWLTMVSAASDRDPAEHVGAPRAVSYRVGYIDPISVGGPNTSFSLYRAIANATDTFRDGLELENHQADFWATRATTELGDFLVGNIIEFKISYLPAGSNTWRTLMSAGDFLSVRSGLCEHQAPDPLDEGISSIEVGLTVLSSQGWDLLKSGAISRERAINEFGRSFTRRTSIFNNPR